MTNSSYIVNSNNFVLLNTHLYICGSYANNSAIYIVYHLQLCSLHEYSCYIAHTTVNNNQSINHHNKYVVECCQNQITSLLVYHFSMLLFTFEVALPFRIAILYTGFVLHNYFNFTVHCFYYMSSLVYLYYTKWLQKAWHLKLTHHSASFIRQSTTYF